MRRRVELTVYRGWGTAGVTRQHVKVELNRLTQEATTVQVD